MQGAGGGLQQPSAQALLDRRHRLSRLRLYFFVTIGLCCLLLANSAHRQAPVVHVVGTTVALLAGCLVVALYADVPQAGEFASRFQVFETTLLVSRILVQLVVACYQDSVPVLLKLLALFLLPLSVVIESAEPGKMLFCFVAHFLIACFGCFGSFFDDGWQYLLVLLFYYGVIADGFSSESDSKAAVDATTLSLLKAVRALLSMVCDGVVVLDDAGDVKCMDPKSESLLEARGKIRPGESCNFQDFMDTSQGPDSDALAGHLSQGLRTMYLRTPSTQGQKMEVEAYTVPFQWSPILKTSLSTLLGRPLCNEPASATGQFYFRGFRSLGSDGSDLSGSSGGQRQVSGSSGFRPPKASNHHSGSLQSSGLGPKTGGLGSKLGGPVGGLGGGLGGGLQYGGGAGAGRTNNLSAVGSLKDLGPRLENLGLGGLSGGLGGGLGVGPVGFGSGLTAGLSAGLARGGAAAPKSGQNQKPPRITKSINPADQVASAMGEEGEALSPRSVTSNDAKPVAPVENGENGEEAFPAGPWRSMQTVGPAVGEYTKVRIIAKGSQGKVNEVEAKKSPYCPDGTRLAHKEIPLPGLIWQRDFPRLLQSADREVRALKGLAWASGVVVQLIDCWISPDFKQANIVMELLPHSLRDILEGRRRQNQGQPPFEQSARWLLQSAVGLASIHYSGYIHRDIKPSNLLLTQDLRHCKIADLGVSRPLVNTGVGQGDEGQSDCCSDLQAGSKVGTEISDLSRMTGATEASSILSGYTMRPGTKAYMSPESLKSGLYDVKLDVFSLGCVLLELLTMTSVPNMKLGEAVRQLAIERVESVLTMAEQKVKEGGSEDSPEDNLENFRQLRSICLQMLDPNPEQRPSAVEVARTPIFSTHRTLLLQEFPVLLKSGV
eukprot:TRINITY_DN41718_c0_g2_i1.p1 TRINITY_DN41718_c0_g2~~TRINITY_DN41718_c0_g2_i1.p1  ORF type:complete len:889 (-),score=202.49 TRINITY_DN41718_c0_g2_i1:226-2892(-)